MAHHDPMASRWREKSKTWRAISETSDFDSLAGFPMSRVSSLCCVIDSMHRSECPCMHRSGPFHRYGHLGSGHLERSYLLSGIGTVFSRLSSSVIWRSPPGDNADRNWNCFAGALVVARLGSRRVRTFCDARNGLKSPPPVLSGNAPSYTAKLRKDRPRSGSPCPT
jgi:hypothetical protein